MIGRPTLAFAVAIGCGLVLAACEDEGAPASLLPETYPEGFTEVRDCRFSVEHSAVNIRILADGPAAAVIADESYPFAVGALVVKEEYRDMECTQLEGYTLMERRAADDDEASDGWAWQRLDATAVPIGPDDDRSCSTCHRACTTGRDGVCADP